MAAAGQCVATEIPGRPCSAKTSVEVFMAKSNGSQKELTIGFPAELVTWLEGEAERDCRSVGGQVRFIVSAARRAGAPTSTPWPPPMPPMPKTLDEGRAALAEATREFDELKALQRRGGQNGLGLHPRHDERFRYLRDHVANLENFVRLRERMESTA
jgi:hypothetical protein